MTRPARPDPDPRHDQALDDTPCAWAALHSACCLTGWESRGGHHDPITCTRKA